MTIYEVTEKKKYLPLLLLGDEQESMIDRYIEHGAMFVLDNGATAIGEITVCEITKTLLEIKNLAILPEHRRKGYGKALIEFVCEKYRNTYSAIQVGTGDSPLTVPFYEKCGFIRSHTVKNFFTENYDHPIIENGVRLVDMIYFKRKLTGVK